MYVLNNQVVVFFSAILLAHLKIPMEEIRQAILDMDDTKISDAHLQTILACAVDEKRVSCFFANIHGTTKMQK